MTYLMAVNEFLTRSSSSKKMSTSSLLIPATYTMVRISATWYSHRVTRSTGTGLSDGFPAGGVDAHEVYPLIQPSITGY